MELVGEDVKRAYFDSAELSTKDEDEELATDVLVAEGKNAREMLVSLGAAKVSQVQQAKVSSNVLLTEERLLLEQISLMDLQNSCRKIGFILGNV